MGKYKCPLCSCFFKNTYKRAQHLRDCVKEKVVGGKDKVAGKYRCPLCYTTFTLASNRYRHINTFCLRAYLNQLTKQDSKPSQKPEHNSLKENEETKQELQVVKVPKSVPKYRCSLCPAVFWNPSGIYRHRKKHELFKLTGKKIRYRHSDSSVMGKPPTLNSAETEESKDTSHSNEEITNHSLSCNYCGKSFSTSQSLKKHESDHKGEKPYHCLECGKGFKKHTHLIGHKGVHQRKIQCTVCKKILPSIRELLQHRRSHLKRGMLQCPDCHVQFQYPAHLIRHVNAHRKREIKALKREERSQLKLKLQQSLEILKEQSGAKQLQCSLCQEVFNDAHGLRKHCLTHISGPLSHQCPFCDRNFTNRRGLLRHMVRHTGDKAFSCTNCGKQFYRQIYLKLHIEQCLPAQNKHPVTSGQCLPAQNKHPVTVQLDKTPRKMGSHKCSYCPRLFSKKIRLKNHLNGHRKNTLLHCSRCNQYYGFTKLTSHQKNCNGPEVSDGLSVPKSSYDNSTSKMRPNIPKRDLQSSSTKILQFKCSYCTQRFRYRSLLLRHVVSHTGLQPYACVHCGHRFGSRTSCVTHEANCSDVNKEGESSVDASKQLSNMPTLRVVAQKLQTEGETEYKCKFCTKTFMKSRNLRRHILTHNEVKPYRCKACDNCFSRYDHLKVHQIRCKGRRSRLEVCIPKISLDDVGKGWQNKFNLNPTEKQETFECTICSRSFPTHAKLSRHNTLFHSTKLFKCAGCGASFSHEKSLKHHRKVKRCRKLSKETGEPSPLVTVLPEESVTKPLDRVRNQILQRIQPHYSKNYKYVCNYCPRAFGNGYQLRVHTRLHTGERPFACDYCGERFIRKDYVLRHYPKCIKKPHQKKVLCHRCGGFFHQIKLKSHKKSCMLASSSSKSTVDKSQPSSSQSPPKGFSCAYCSSRFLLFSQLQEHFLDEHKMETMFPPASTVPLQHHLSSIPNIKEEPVDKSCDKQPNLTYKMDTAVVGEVSKSFSCSVCNMRFLNKAGLTGHQRVHTKDPPFICKTCKRGFWNKFLLRNHQRKCRPESNPLSISTQKSDVPLKAKLDFALNDSVLVFNEGTKTIGTGVLQTNFSCKEDLSETPQNSEGNETQDISNKDKKAVQYQCSECEQSFTDGLMLISHLEDHGREEQEKKRNTCLKCGRVFSSQGFLEKHMKMHGINKKYSCPNCPEMFYMSSDLEAHMLCHDINRPYACKFCNERFWTRPALCNHYSEEHPDDVYHCRFCNKAYSVKKSLSRHYKKWHQQEQKEYSIAQEKKYADKQLSSQVSTTESYEDDNNDMEDSDSDCAPYFPCHVCGKTFPTSESLEDHQRCHLGEKPHECAECGRCFFQASQLQQHQRMHKSEFQCQACGRGFVSLFALRKHKHTHGKSRPYRCPRCDFSFTGPSQLAEHMSTHREENFPCDICNRIFLSKSSRAEHRKCHSKLGGHYSLSVSRKMHKESDSHPKVSAVNKELKYRCGVCSERFRDPEKLSEHGCMAAKERPYTCLDCDKHFLHASHLKKHTNIHGLSLPGGQYPCYQCNTTFSSAQQFLSHLKSHDFTNTEMNYQTKEGASTQRYTCPVCRQDFGSAAEMTEHFSMHSDSSFNCKMAFPSGSELEEHEHHHLTSTTQSECTDCGEKFLGSNNIHQHSCFLQRNRKMVNQHSNPLSKTAPTHQAAEEEDIDVTGEDLYYCPICSMQFSSKSKLLEHQNKHRNEKPFSCELCGKTFALRRYLKEHERRHWQKSVTQTTATLSEKKHKCTQCKAEFKTSQELSLHLRFHAEKEVGEFRCDMCYKSFSKWSYLKQHQESHVGQVVYECDECEKAFAFPHLLEEHQLSHAGSSR
ncbi:zinc finger protein 1035 [Antennarius striatus]|uniref:zinc finger protein 1035 n=1 Tax=Antennarius striatus TaxID=241820 RepID=UPI0035B0C4A0